MKKVLWLITAQQIGNLLYDISRHGNFKNYFFIIETDIDNRVKKSFVNKSPFETFGKSFDIKKIIEKISPDIVAMGHDNLLYERTFLLIAKKLGIKTILIQEGGIPYFTFSKKAPDETQLFTLKMNSLANFRCGFSLIKAKMFKEIIELIKEKQKIGKYIKFKKIDNYGVYGCDKIFVMGKYFKEILIKKGVKGKTIEITGSPLIDSVYNSKNKTISKGNIILFIDEPQVKDQIWTKEKKRRIINSIKKELPVKYKLVIKKHPRSLDIGFPPGMTFSSDNLHSSILRSAAIIGIESTGLLESVLLKKPTITLIDHMYSKPNIFTENKITYSIKNVNELQKIETIISSEEKRIRSKDYQKLLKNIFYKFDSGSAKRIVEKIANM